MNRWLAVLVLPLVLSGCSDDTQPPADKGITLDVKKAGDGVAPAGDKGTAVFPEARPGDQAIWKCTPGAANMCDDYKTQYCLNGVCTPCPADKTDCDRQGDCECAGVCDGTKCKTP